MTNIWINHYIIEQTLQITHSIFWTFIFLNVSINWQYLEINIEKEREKESYKRRSEQWRETIILHESKVKWERRSEKRIETRALKDVNIKCKNDIGFYNRVLGLNPELGFHNLPAWVRYQNTGFGPRYTQAKTHHQNLVIYVLNQTNIQTSLDEHG